MNNTKIKVFFILPSLRAGGAERVISFIADNLDRSKFESCLVIIESNKGQAYQLNHINPIFLNKKRSRNAFFRILWLIIRNRPNVVLSSIGQINTMLSIYAILLRNTKFITRETFVRGTRFKQKSSGVFGYLGKLQKITIDRVVCQSMDIYKNLIENYGFNKEKLVIINNPITSESRIKKKKDKNKRTYRLITIGRLEKQKGYERILSVLSKLDLPFKYTIIGSGSLEKEILEMSKSLNIDKHIEHIPFTKNIHEYLIQSDLYVQGSYYEGFPNALLESCSTGTAVLAFNAPGGINEIIQNGVNGFRVDTEQEFIEKLKLLVEDLPDPKIVRESVTSRYGKEKILAKYEELLIETVDR